MSSTHIYVPEGKIVVYKSPNIGEGELVACEGKLERVVHRDWFVSIFPTRTVFAFSLDQVYSIQGNPLPPVVFFRLQGRGLISKVGMLWRDVWEKQKKEFSLKFQEKIASLHKGNMFFSELEESGVLIAEANKLAGECEMPVIIFGVGRVLYDPTDPFDFV